MNHHTDASPTNHEPSTSAWRRLADLCRAQGVPVRRGARWASAQHDESLALKRRRPAGGSPEWWVSDAGANAFARSLGRPIRAVEPQPVVPARSFWARLRRCLGR